MSRDRGPHGDLCGLAVPYLAHRDDIRVLAQNGAQAVGKGHIHLLVDLHLIDPRNIIFHRVLQSDQVDLLPVQLPDHGVHGGGFTASRGAHDQDHAAVVGDQLGVFIQVRAAEADARLIQKVGGLVQETDHHLFPVNQRQGGNSQIDVLALDPHVGAAVQRNSALRDIHPAHDLDAGDHRRLQVLGHGENLVEHAVDSHAHRHVRLPRLDVNVADPLGHGPLDNGVHQAHRGRADGVLVPDLQGGHRGLRRLLRISRLAHLLDGPGHALVSVQVHDGPVDAVGGGNHGDHTLPGGGFGLLDGHEVHGVLHGQVERILLHPDRHHPEFARDILGYLGGHSGIDVNFGQIHKLDPQLHLKGFDQLLLRDHAPVDEQRSQALLRLLLQLQRMV